MTKGSWYRAGGLSRVGFFRKHNGSGWTYWRTT